MAVLSLNDRSKRVTDALTQVSADVGADVHRVGHAVVVDAGVKVLGSLEAGVYLARACMADLAQVSLVPGRVGDVSLPHVAVSVNHPVPACMASQYAGWQISVGDYFAMGSGPMRATYAKEDLFAEPLMQRFVESANTAVGVLETSQLPTQEIIDYIVDSTKVPSIGVSLLLARTASLAGGVQVVARSVETAMHKLHALKFDLSRIVGGYGCAPVPPVAKDDMAAIGRTNDAVLYGGEVTLYATGDDASLKSVGEQLPSSASRDYGRPFGDVFKQYEYDFYRIDPMLFSPARVCIQNVETGNTYVFGETNHDVMIGSFFSSA
jgi:methenyltetrahydromethanopterin cyclohydrolase